MTPVQTSSGVLVVVLRGFEKHTQKHGKSMNQMNR